ncbi:MAG: hypothetical protein U1F67_24550 [Rubrivivax sp.]
MILRENSAEDGPRRQADRGRWPGQLTAARVESMARGGQVLLTLEARGAALGAGDDGSAGAWRTTSHGHWSLKGLTDPIEVFSRSATKAPSSACPRKGEKAHRMVRAGERRVPVSALPNNLLPQRSSFVGREPR